MIYEIAGNLPKKAGILNERQNFNHLLFMEEILELFKKFPLAQTYNYELDNLKVSFSLDELLKEIPTVMSVDLFFAAVKKTADNGQFTYTKEETAANIDDYIYFMGWKCAHRQRKKTKVNFKKLVEETGYSAGFLKWYVKLKEIDSLQLTCDHIFDDCYTDGGQFANSVGHCAKCRLDQDNYFKDSEDIRDLFEAWEAALKSIKMGKGK